MKFLILIIAITIFASTNFATAKDNTINGANKIDPYNMPTYNKLKIDNPWLRNKTKESVAKPVNSNTPALTIINEPYMPFEKPPVQSLTIRDNQPTDLTPMPLTADIVTAQPKTTETWRARKGESLHSVLSRWSERSETKITWSSFNSPNLPRDVSFIGSYENAVNELIKISGATEIKDAPQNNQTAMIEPVTMPPPAPPLTPEPLTPLDLSPIDKGVTILDSAAPVPLEPIAPQEQERAARAKFYALAGTSLEQTLRAWAAGSDEFALVWDAPHNFSVKQTISNNGDATDAIRDILSAYDNEKNRPVGKLYRDPKSTKPILLVESARVRLR